VWHAISSGVKPRLLLFQKVKNSFKERPQLALVLFIAGQFAESRPLILICHIGQISCGASSCTIAGVILMTTAERQALKETRSISPQQQPSEATPHQAE